MTLGPRDKVTPSLPIETRQHHWSDPYSDTGKVKVKGQRHEEGTKRGLKRGAQLRLCVRKASQRRGHLNCLLTREQEQHFRK